MDTEILGSLIAASATIISAIIGGWVAIKVKNLELKAKKDKTDQSVAKTERRSSQWLWGIGGAVIGVVLAFGILFFINGTSIYPLPTPTAIVNEPSMPSPTPTGATSEKPTNTSPVPTLMGADEEVSLVMAFVPSGDTETIQVSGDKLAEMISARTGYNVTVNVATSYAAVIEAMGAGNAQIGWLNTVGYILAHEKYKVEVALATVRLDSTSYKGQIITQADSGITSIADLKGKTFCRSDPLSTSGWIVPKIMLAAERLDPDSDLQVIDVGSHNNVVTAVYSGECDAGATFVDARGTVEDDIPDIKEKVVVITESADIPNDTVSFSSDVSERVREKVVNVLLELAGTEEGKAALEQLYGITGLTYVDDSFYDDFRVDLNASGYTIEDLVE
jgi:phosphonate transport system substrate-binding protein